MDNTAAKDNIVKIVDSILSLIFITVKIVIKS